MVFPVFIPDLSIVAVFYFGQVEPRGIQFGHFALEHFTDIIHLLLVVLHYLFQRVCAYFERPVFFYLFGIPVSHPWQVIFEGGKHDQGYGKSYQQNEYGTEGYIHAYAAELEFYHLFVGILIHDYQPVAVAESF